MNLLLIRFFKIIERKAANIARNAETRHLKKHFPDEYQQIQKMFDDISLMMKNGPNIKIEK